MVELGKVADATGGQVIDLNKLHVVMSMLHKFEIIKGKQVQKYA